MLDWLKPKRRRVITERNEPAPTHMSQRRFESAKTDRLNDSHWVGADGQTINAQLIPDLATMRARASFEANQNGVVEGVITTHQETIVGVHGPTLQVQSENKVFNVALERIWKRWWKHPDIAGALSGVEMLELWVWGLWTTGEYFVHLTSDESVKQGISLRLQNIASSRIATPWGSFGHDNIIMGIKRLPNGRPISYSVQNGDLNELGLSKVEFEEVPADKMIHGFRTREAGQARGIPWLNSSLPAIADMRDYDEQVLDAARAAADYAVFMQTTSPDIEAVAMNESTDIERRTLSTLPPGYVLSEAKANQPSTKYIEFRRERQADIGKPVGMPEMMVRLDSSGHNYSSARFDGQLYRAGIDKQRARIEEKALNIFVDLVATEARVAGLLPPVPVDMELLWTWPAAPHVDPKKEADAERIQLESGTLTYTKALSSKGMDLDTTIETRKIETEKLAKAGLPPVPTADGSSDTSDDDDDDDDATNTNTGSEEDEDDEGMFG